jgi:L-ascorbate metabolism protein UlaG (beta-lactamase superfamily)
MSPSSVSDGGGSYLREDVRVEPLVGGFRAWTQLLPPHTYAVNLVAKHLPKLRQAAEESGSVAALLATTLDGQADVVEFAQALGEADELLAAEADGRALEPLYAQVPAPLKGYVELVYDRAGNPSLRFLEGLLYGNGRAHEELQGLEMRLLAADAEELRMRTPRVEREGAVQCRLAFDDGAWDVLARARTEAVPRAGLEAVLGSDHGLDGFLTGEPPAREETEPLTEGMRARFFGHACVLMQSPRSNVLVDPLIAPRPRGQTGRRSFPDLPDHLDCLVITHGHMDHLDIETLLYLRHRTDTVVVPKNRAGNILDPSLGLVVRALGFGDVREVQEMESVELEDGEIVAVPFLGEHADLDIVAKSAYAISLAGRTALCSADARNLAPEVFDHVHGAVGRVHAAFLGMECEGSPLSLAHGPFLAGPVSPEIDESRRTNGNDAAGALAIVDALECPAAYVYAMGFEPWLTFMFGVPDETRAVALREISTFLDGCRDRRVEARLLEGADTITI